jgi:hypothetical protein
MIDSNANGAILSHFFQAHNIEQATDDTVLRGQEIPKGYVNIGQMCFGRNKRLSSYLKNTSTLEYFIAVMESGTPTPHGRSKNASTVAGVSGRARTGNYIRTAYTDDHDTEPMEAMRQSLVFYRSRIQKFRANRKRVRQLLIQ